MQVKHILISILTVGISVLEHFFHRPPVSLSQDRILCKGLYTRTVCYCFLLPASRPVVLCVFNCI